MPREWFLTVQKQDGYPDNVRRVWALKWTRAELRQAIYGFSIMVVQQRSYEARRGHGYTHGWELVAHFPPSMRLDDLYITGSKLAEMKQRAEIIADLHGLT